MLVRRRWLLVVLCCVLVLPALLGAQPPHPARAQVAPASGATVTSQTMQVPGRPLTVPKAVTSTGNAAPATVTSAGTVAGPAAGSAPPREIPFRPISTALTSGRNGALNGRATAAAPASAMPSAPSAAVSNASDLSGNAGGSGQSLRGQPGPGFDGVSAVESAAVNQGLEASPPDEGVCTNGQTVFNLVNVAGAFFTAAGQPTGGPISAWTLFAENPATEVQLGDVRCFWDPLSNAWFASAGASNTSSESHIDLAVNTNADPSRSPWTVYHIDTTSYGNGDCPCFPDQPLLGVDSTVVTVVSNQYGQLGNGNFDGAVVFVFDKSSLLQGSGSPTGAVFGPLTNCFNSGQVCFSLQPASSQVGRAAEPGMYYVSSSDYSGTASASLQVWVVPAVAGGARSGNLVLYGVQIPSQSYAMPVSARQWGSPLLLSGDDDRIEGAWESEARNTTTLWATLNSAVSVAGDSTIRDGIAWFAVTPEFDSSQTFPLSATIASQGLLGAQGFFLLYPAIATGAAGEPVLSFSLTGPQYFPSAAYAVGGSGGTQFTTIAVYGQGTAADADFTCAGGLLAPQPCRWGDYSAAVPAPAAGGVLVGAQYINAGKTANFTNWDNRLLVVPAP